MRTTVVLFFSLFFSWGFAQKFEVLFLIDKVYDEYELRSMLEKWNILSLVKEDYLTIKMVSSSENESKIKFHNKLDGKDKAECDVVSMSDVFCNPCRRLAEAREIDGGGSVKIFIQNTGKSLATCDLGIDDYEAISEQEDLGEMIKKHKKLAKKSKKNYKVIFWVPSGQTVKLNLTVKPNLKKVEFGEEVTFIASTNSEVPTNVLMKVNNVPIPQCSDQGFTMLDNTVSLFYTDEIIKPTVVTLEIVGCGNPDPEEIKIDLISDCNKPLEKVKYDIMHNSVSLGSSLGTKKNNINDNTPYTVIKLIDNESYFVIVNKQCGIQFYQAEVVDIQTNETFEITLSKDENLNQSLVHLSELDRKNYSLFIISKKTIEDLGIGAEQSDGSDHLYKMRIVPLKAYKEVNINGLESKYEVVKFQKCN